MKRVVSIYLPMWSIDRLRRRRRAGRDDRAAMLLVRVIAGREIIAQCCPRSAQRGVRPQMTLAHARALLAGLDLHIAPHEPERDAEALRALARWAIQFAPLVAPDPPAGLLLDATGCERLYGGDRRLLNAIANSLNWLGFHVRIACAGTIGAAWAFARYGEHDRCVIEPGDEEASLAPLPINALRLNDETMEGLREVGIEHIADLLALPRLELAARFSGDLLLRLDQALGETTEVFDPVRTNDPPRIEREFDGPVTQLESILCAARESLDHLSEQLHRQERGARALRITLERIDADPVHESIILSRPSRNAQHLWALLRPKLEMINLGYGVERIALIAQRTGRLRHEQLRHVDDDAEDASKADAAFGEFVDTLRHRLGPERILRATPMESHLPERAFPHESVTVAQPAKQNAVQVTASDRPSALLARPEAIEVMAMTPDGPPLWIRCRGSEHRLISSAGPERIAGEWWRSGRPSSKAAVTRDYFKVQAESGRWLWICQVLETGRWYLHGEWA